MDEQKSWFSRNWIWAVPSCGCLIIIVLVISGVGALIFGVSSLFKNSPPYEYAVKQAKTNTEVIFNLGKSIETVGMINGSISINNDSGSADFRVHLTGEKGDGTLVVVAERFDGEWVYEDLYVIIKGSQERINLLDQVLEGI